MESIENDKDFLFLLFLIESLLFVTLIYYLE